MSNKGGPYKARVNDETHDAWYYVDDGGITVVAELRPGGEYKGTTQAKLTRKQLERALELMR